MHSNIVYCLFFIRQEQKTCAKIKHTQTHSYVCTHIQHKQFYWFTFYLYEYCFSILLALYSHFFTRKMVYTYMYKYYISNKIVYLVMFVHCAISHSQAQEIILKVDYLGFDCSLVNHPTIASKQESKKKYTWIWEKIEVANQICFVVSFVHCNVIYLDR